jgi:hypothetical protein
MFVHLFLALVRAMVSNRWRLLFPTLCWSINTECMVPTVSRQCVQNTNISNKYKQFYSFSMTIINNTLKCSLGIITRTYTKSRSLLIGVDRDHFLSLAMILTLYLQFPSKSSYTLAGFRYSWVSKNNLKSVYLPKST